MMPGKSSVGLHKALAILRGAKGPYTAVHEKARVNGDMGWKSTYKDADGNPLIAIFVSNAHSTMECYDTREAEREQPTSV